MSASPFAWGLLYRQRFQSSSVLQSSWRGLAHPVCTMHTWRLIEEVVVGNWAPLMRRVVNVGSTRLIILHKAFIVYAPARSVVKLQCSTMWMLCSTMRLLCSSHWLLRSFVAALRVVWPFCPASSCLWLASVFSSRHCHIVPTENETSTCILVL